ncbi:hypothetical protein BFP70_00015 [Thioclava sp. SK-1]|uniref:LysR substrate-binding domain-containing protein n=1 Tax=Thioclava sp. SK-1 TaxID=1889770 RepID=UPI000824C825|nr:LysR substrate-binding domain-containing protein [Thioclava sp. SK-1]OCX66596.1 hypothetical protein BFP70_00015 [Thioclava sp. SK-1]
MIPPSLRADAMSILSKLVRPAGAPTPGATAAPPPGHGVVAALAAQQPAPTSFAAAALRAAAPSPATSPGLASSAASATPSIVPTGTAAAMAASAAMGSPQGATPAAPDMRHPAPPTEAMLRASNPPSGLPSPPTAGVAAAYVAQRTAVPPLAEDSLRPNMTERGSDPRGPDTRAADRAPVERMSPMPDRANLGELGIPIQMALRGYSRKYTFDRAPDLTGDKVALDLGCLDTFASWLLPELLVGLDGLAPKITYADQDGVIQAVLSQRIELGLVHDVNLPPTLSVAPLLSLVPYVLLTADHPLANAPGIVPEALSGQPFISLNCPPARDYFPNLLEGAGVDLHIGADLPDLDSVRAAVARGRGFGMIAARADSADRHHGPGLRAVPLALEDPVLTRAVLVNQTGVSLGNGARILLAQARHLIGA